MIFFEIFFFLIITLLSIYTFAGLGQLILNQNEKLFFESIFFGFIVASFIITLLHFFIKINFYVIFLVFASGFLYSVKKFELINFDYKKNYIYFIIFFVFVPIYLSQKYHEDFGYYHLPYAINLLNEKIIFGMANVNSAFIHNSIWLNLIALFNVKDNFNFLTLPSFLIYVFFILFALKNTFNHQRYKGSQYFLIVCLFYLILKFTRISEFGTDLPATLFSLLAIFYFIRNFELTETNDKIFNFYFVFCFTTFSILIKYSCIPLIILVIFNFFKDFKILKKEIFKLKYVFIYTFVFLFFLQQFIYSGCFIFPSEYTCFKTSWHDKEFLDMKSRLELINKSYSFASKEISKEIYLLNFNWVPFWIKRNYTEILEHLITMFFPIIIFLILLKKDNKKYNINYNYFIFIVFTLSGLVFWFMLSPVFRFSIPFFLFITFLITLNFYIKKKFSNKFFITLISIAIIFNLSKNIFRISEKDNIYFGIDKVNNRYIQLSNIDSTKLNINKPDIKKNNENGWQGRLCWDIPFLCTYNEVVISKKYGYLFVNKLNKPK